MYYDLNVPCESQPNRIAIDRLKLILSRFSQLDQTVVALNCCVSEKDLPNVKPLNEIPFDIVKHPVKQLTRITIETSSAVSNDTLTQLRSTFDLIAVRPSTLNTFEDACYNLNIDIISLDCSVRLPFRVDAHSVQKAIQRGVYFEITYSAGIRDTTARGYFLQVANILVCATNGNNLIVSSEAETVADLRASYDAFYLMKSLSLPNDKAQFVTGKHCEQLLRKIGH
ncbi:RNase P subunit p30-domain-containing protein [Radiomyces spectabilis]|uniref:RNase P subunit p30-domain-containing protein n=1 Tax=Radiomyces spectabilis TaxID=64574 RepID=UPI002220446C|nr:RNase P subunit p30-domain-containing protein [Radiomyces spectabilis]KAI8368156.1 RNase P subunit p30-domain-containing protein [Radiomyces spectabilis]